MALSEEQKKLVQEYFDKFEDNIYGELRNSSNQTTSYVKDLITKYEGEARKLYYRNAINNEMFTSLKGKLYELSGELQKEMMGKEVSNVNNPLDKNDFIKEDKFNALLKEWTDAYKEYLQDRLEMNNENFTTSYVKSIREKLLKGTFIHPAFDNFNKLVKNHNLSNRMQKIVVDEIDKITLEFLEKARAPKEAKETTRGTNALEKYQETFEKKFRKIISDLIDRAENTMEKLEDEREKLFQELINLKNEGEISQGDANIIANSLIKIEKENSKLFTSSAKYKAEKEKLTYATDPNKAVLKEDFNDVLNVAGEEIKGILYAPREMNGIKKGAYTLNQGFEYFTKKLISIIDLADNQKLAKNILLELKNTKESIIKTNGKTIVLSSKLVKKLLTTNKTEKTSFLTSDLYYFKGNEDIYYSSKELCFINNYKKVFINYKSKKEYVEQSVKGKTEGMKNDSFAFLKFRFKDGTIIECLDSEGKSREEVLAEAKKVYQQMKRRG